MNFYSLILYLVILVPASQKETPATLDVHQRVNLLKRQIAEEIKEQKRFSDKILPIDASNDYTYVDLKDVPITPIMDFDKRKKDGRFKLREIKTASPRTTREAARSRRPILKSRDTGNKTKRPNKPVVEKPIDTFYRRVYSSPDEPLEWIHCQDLITPYIAGHKQEVSAPKLLTPSDHLVWRFLQLIRINTTSFQKEEIYSVLYQISNLQLRLFQWDLSAVTLLLATLSDDKPKTFRSITSGIRKLLEMWHLDISNHTNLLRQARIFRPPCVRVSDYEGSTKTSKGTRFTKKHYKTTCSVTGPECATPIGND